MNSYLISIEKTPKPFFFSRAGNCKDLIWLDIYKSLQIIWLIISIFTQKYSHTQWNKFRKLIFIIVSHVRVCTAVFNYERLLWSTKMASDWKRQSQELGKNQQFSHSLYVWHHPFAEHLSVECWVIINPNLIPDWQSPELSAARVPLLNKEPQTLG